MLAARWCVLATALVGAAAPCPAQLPVEGEVRQIVTFTFLPGTSAQALTLYRERALPLYRQDEAMLSMRAFREVESPVPLGLMVVRAFQGMAGMDRSNEALRELGDRAGVNVAALYGQIGALTSGHTDQFVEMVPSLGAGDPASRRLTAFVWYRLVPGADRHFEGALATTTLPFERQLGIPSATGRFLLSDGWHLLRMLGFDSLGDYQGYWEGLAGRPGIARIEEMTAERREVIVTSVTELTVR